MQLRNICFSGLLLFMSLTIGFAQPSGTDLILLDFIKVGDQYLVETPRLLNHFNVGNYNNQPSFVDANTVLFSAVTGQGKSNDIYAIDLLRKKHWQVTDTPDGEYSPTLMPTKRHFSAIKMEEGTNIQRLWQFPIDQSNSGKDLFPGITGVGYHCWLDRETVAMFIVADPLKLIVANRSTQEQRTVIEDIGRGMRANKKGYLYFIHKLSDDNWMIKRYDPQNNKITNIVQTPGKTEDFELLPDETIIMGSGSKLFSYHPDFSEEWKEIKDLEEFGINKISRLAIFGQKLVLVSNN